MSTQIEINQKQIIAEQKELIKQYKILLDLYEDAKIKQNKWMRSLHSLLMINDQKANALVIKSIEKRIRINI